MSRGPDRLLLYAGRVHRPRPWLGGGQVPWDPASPPLGVLQHGRALGTLLSLQLPLRIQRDKTQFWGPGMGPLPGRWLCWPSPRPQHWEEPPRAEPALVGAGPSQHRAPEPSPLPGCRPGEPPCALAQEQGPRPPCPQLRLLVPRGGSSSQANEGAPATTSLESSRGWAGWPPRPGLPCGWFSSWERFNL